MKYIQFIMAIAMITSCVNSSPTIDSELSNSGIVSGKDTVFESLNKEIKESDIIIEKELAFDSLVGTWYYTTFTDSTIKYKKLYDFNNLLPAYSYALIFEKEKPDSVYLKGYWGESYEKIKRVKPTAYIIEYDERRRDSLITMKQGENLIINYKRQDYDPDPKKIKWEDNFFYKKELEIDDIEIYFAKKIFSGKYIDIDRNREVLLTDSLSILGLSEVKSFHISMGRYEYYDHMDILSLRGNGQYHWKFNKDTLMLIEATLFEDNGGPAGFNLGEVKYKFVKKK